MVCGTIAPLYGSARALLQCGVVGGGSFPLVAVCPCVWLVAGLRVLVVDEEVVIHITRSWGVYCASCAYTWTRCCRCASALLTALSCM